MRLFYPIFGIITAMLGYAIHGSLIWSIVNFFFWPISIVVFLIRHELTLPIIKQTFAWFF